MFTNYRYFIVLAQEGSISRAAERLFLSHQNLSKYLANLEAEFGVTLFERKPTFRLTPAGQAMLEALRQVETLERGLRDEYADLREDRTGEITLGTTEGRFRILMPNLISAFQAQFPHVQLRIVSAPSTELKELVLNNRLDLMIAGLPDTPSRFLSSTVVLQERLYLVVSDQMLRQYFPGEVQACKQRWQQQGVDLREFQAMPFALNLPHFNSSRLLKQHMDRMGAELRCVHVSSHPDLHHMMSARNYAASFCLTMYLPGVARLNQSQAPENQLNVFPIRGLTETNPVAVSYLQSRRFRRHTQALLQMIRHDCSAFGRYDLKQPQ